jgi:hypothetical protein
MLVVNCFWFLVQSSTTKQNQLIGIKASKYIEKEHGCMQHDELLNCDWLSVHIIWDTLRICTLQQGQLWMVPETTGWQCQSNGFAFPFWKPVLAFWLYKGPTWIQQTRDSFKWASYAVGYRCRDAFNPWHQWHPQMIFETLLQLQPDRESWLLYRSAPPFFPCEERAWYKTRQWVTEQK